MKIFWKFQIHVKLGRALKEGEYRAKVFLLDVKEEEVGCFIIMAIMSLFLKIASNLHMSETWKLQFFFYLIWNWFRIFAPNSHKKGEIIVLLPWNTFRNTVEREESKIKVNAVNLIFNLWFSQFKVISEEFIKKISLFTLGTHLKLD